VKALRRIVDWLLVRNIRIQRREEETAAHTAIREFAERHEGLSLNEISNGNPDLMDGFDSHFETDATWLTNEGVFGTDEEQWGTQGLENVKPTDIVDHLEQRGGSTGLPINLHWRVRATIAQALERGFILGRKFERELSE
jgi:hypothetical protein